MEKLFVPFEIAKKMKELGFDEPCFGCWTTRKFYPNDPEPPYFQCWIDDEKSLTDDSNGLLGFSDGTFIKAGLYDQVIGWLLTKHAIRIEPILLADLRWSAWIIPNVHDTKIISGGFRAFANNILITDSRDAFHNKPDCLNEAITLSINLIDKR